MPEPSPGPCATGVGGTDPTVTDANAALGLLRDGTQLGPITVDRTAAREAMAGLAAALGRSAAEVGRDIRTVANTSMEHAARLVANKKGADPRGSAVLAYGGAGPLHAADLAEQLGIARVVVPEWAGLLSAYGALLTEIRRDYAQTNLLRLEGDIGGEYRLSFERLEERARRDLARVGLEPQL